MLKSKKIRYILVFVVLAAIAILAIRSNRGGGGILGGDRIASRGEKKGLPSRNKEGKGELTEHQQRELFKAYVGFDIPKTATDFDGVYNHIYMRRDDVMWGSRISYFTLPPNEASELFERINDAWALRGTDNENFNYFVRSVAWVALTPPFGDAFPAGSERVGLSSIDGERDTVTIILNSTTGRFRFYNSFKVR